MQARLQERNESHGDGHNFDRDPKEQIWWKEGEGDIPYLNESPDALIADTDPAPIPEEDYLGVEDLEYMRVMVKETGIDSDSYLEKVQDSRMHPVHRWQVRQVIEEPAMYAVEVSDYDGAPEPADVEVSSELTDAAFEEYHGSRGFAPGTSLNGYLEDTEEEESLDPQGLMAL